MSDADQDDAGTWSTPAASGVSGQDRSCKWGTQGNWEQTHWFFRVVCQPTCNKLLTRTVRWCPCTLADRDHARFCTGAVSFKRANWGAMTRII